MMQGCTRVLPGTPLVKHLPLHDYGFYTQVCMIYTHTKQVTNNVKGQLSEKIDI